METNGKLETEKKHRSQGKHRKSKDKRRKGTRVDPGWSLKMARNKDKGMGKRWTEMKTDSESENNLE